MIATTTFVETLLTPDVTALARVKASIELATDPETPTTDVAVNEAGAAGEG